MRRSEEGSQTDLGYQVRFDKRAAKARIAAAIEAAGGNYELAAVSLGVSYATIRRWRRSLGMEVGGPGLPAGRKLGPRRQPGRRKAQDSAAA